MAGNERFGRDMISVAVLPTAFSVKGCGIPISSCEISTKRESSCPFAARKILKKVVYCCVLLCVLLCFAASCCVLLSLFKFQGRGESLGSYAWTVAIDAGG